jgi:hypothetical protein
VFHGLEATIQSQKKCNFNPIFRRHTMNKLLITVLGGLFAASLGLNAIAAETAPADSAPSAEVAKEKPAAPAKKAHKAKKNVKKSATKDTSSDAESTAK